MGGSMNFKIRFELSEYVKKVHANGSCTFAGNSTKNSLRFIFKKHNLKANTVYPSFDEEYMANSNMRCDSFKSLMIINKLSKLL